MRALPFTRTVLSLLVFAAPLAAPLGAQAAASKATPSAAEQVVEPGMSREQVMARLGRPGGIRTVGTRTYLFYPNGRERSAGMNDVVFLENDAVVDAIFRAPHRRYAGTSSSSAGVRPEATNVVMRATPSNMSAGARAGAESKPPVRTAPTELPPIRRP